MVSLKIDYFVRHLIEFHGIKTHFTVISQRTQFTVHHAPHNSLYMYLGLGLGKEVRGLEGYGLGCGKVG